MWECEYVGLARQCLPNKECFARGNTWKFQLNPDARNFARDRDRHLQAHENHESQKADLEEAVRRVRRCEDGFSCSCGFTHSQLSRVLNHTCKPTEGKLALPCRSSLQKFHPYFHPLTNCGPEHQPKVQEHIPIAEAAARSRDEAKLLSMVSVGSLCNVAKLPQLHTAQRPLQQGDFFPHPRRQTSFCCVWSQPQQGETLVRDFDRYPKRGGCCSQHKDGGGCWRMSSNDPYPCILPDIAVTLPLLVARPVESSKSPHVLDRCFQKCRVASDAPFVNLADWAARVHAFAENSLANLPTDDTSLTLAGHAKEIFEDIACAALAYCELPLRCPQGDDSVLCHIRRCGKRNAGKYVSSQGVRLVPF